MKLRRSENPVLQNTITQKLKTDAALPVFKFGMAYLNVLKLSSL